MSSGLTDTQTRAIDVAERVSSGFSLAGAFFILFSFGLTSRYRRPVNRMIFYASFGNVFSNMGTLIGRNAIETLHGRRTSPLCEFQAFLLQTFMPADALFALCMAINVYLNVKHKFEATSLRKLELYYVLISYLVPFAVGFILIWIKDGARGPVYGDAILWCWIRREWDVLRIATFYGPVWFIVLSTFLIYAFTFRLILRIRKSLRNYRAEEKIRNMKKKRFQERRIEHSGRPLASSNPLPDSTGLLTTGNSVLSHPGKPSDATAPAVSFLEPAALGRLQTRSLESGGGSVNITAKPNIRASSIIENAYKMTDTQSSKESDRSYNETLDMAEGDAPAPVDSVNINPTNPHDPADLEKCRSAMRANRAAWAYARCAMLFFCGLLITWLPSSMNRVYTYVHNDTNFVLSLLSALVLPGQGFWNLLIYTSTSWRSTRRLWRDVKFNLRRGRPKIRVHVKVEGCHRAGVTSDDEED